MTEAKYMVELFSGGERVQHWYVSDKIYKATGGFWFTDMSTDKTVQITGTIIITHL